MFKTIKDILSAAFAHQSDKEITYEITGNSCTIYDGGETRSFRLSDVSDVKMSDYTHNIYDRTRLTIYFYDYRRTIVLEKARVFKPVLVRLVKDLNKTFGGN